MSKYATHPELQQFELKLGLILFDSKDDAVSKRASQKARSAACGYSIVDRVVKGLTPETAVKPTKAVLKELESTVKELAAQGVVGISGESVLMLPLQSTVRTYTSVPVFMSSLLQVAMLIPAHDKRQTFAIVTKYPNVLNLEKGLVLDFCGIEVSADRFRVVGSKGRTPKEVADELVAMKRMTPALSGVIFDCFELLEHADAVRAATSFPVFDQVTLLDFFASARDDNPYFGTSYSHLKERTSVRLFTKAKRVLFSPSENFIRDLSVDIDKDACVGVLRLEYSYPPIPGDVDHPASYGYRVHYEQVDGLTFEKAQEAVLDDTIKTNFQKAISKLEAKGVVAITGDCGFMMAYQPFVAALTDTPVILSSIVQAPLMVAAHEPSAKFAVLTANSSTFDKKLLLAQSGVTVDPNQWIVVGLQDLDGFEAVALGEKVPAEKVQPGIVRSVKNLMAKEKNLAGILLECTELPHYADSIRANCKLPVLDVITLVDYFQNSCTTHPGYSKKALEAVVGLLDPRVQASLVIKHTSGTLGTVRAVGGTVFSKAASCCSVL